MTKIWILTVSLLMILFLSIVVGAQSSKATVEIGVPPSYSELKASTSVELKRIISNGVVLATKNRSGWLESDIAVSLIDVSNPANLLSADIEGERPVYPASVVKLFYLAAIERQITDRKITKTSELERGIRDMIVDSSNEATQYILDVLTDTSSGAELGSSEFAKWQFDRNRVNRYFASMGYRNINVNQKTFCEDAYGVEQQTRGYSGKNRNMITANAAARLMAEIALGRMGDKAASTHMMSLLKRNPFARPSDADDQESGFSGRALIDRGLVSYRLWSKAGWTSTTRHDVAYIETGSGRKFVIAVLTERHANEKDVIPAVVGHVVDNLK